MSFWSWIIQLPVSTKIITGTIVIVASIVSIGAITHSMMGGYPLINGLPTTISVATDCPDRLEHPDPAGLGLWVKGDSQTEINAESEAWVITNCASPTPQSTSATAATPKLLTQNKLTTTGKPTTTPTTTQSATPANSTATPTASPSPSPTADPAKVPTLSNLGISLSGINSTGGPGSIYFSSNISKPFLEFGALVESPNGPKYLYEYTYYVVNNSSVLAAIDGIVNEIRYQSSTDDYEIDLIPTTNSYWNVNYDHITSLTVSKGDSVTAGSAIATAKSKGDYAWVELALLYGGTNGVTGYRYCPLFAADDSFDTTISSLVSSWETFKNDTTIYNESGFLYAPGCTSQRALNE